MSWSGSRPSHEVDNRAIVGATEVGPSSGGQFDDCQPVNGKGQSVAQRPPVSGRNSRHRAEGELLDLAARSRSEPRIRHWREPSGTASHRCFRSSIDVTPDSMHSGSPRPISLVPLYARRIAPLTHLVSSCTGNHMTAVKRDGHQTCHHRANGSSDRGRRSGPAGPHASHRSRSITTVPSDCLIPTPQRREG